MNKYMLMIILSIHLLSAHQIIFSTPEHCDFKNRDIYATQAFKKNMPEA